MKGNYITMIYDIQKANMWKRISAYIFDFIILGIVSVGIAFLLSVAFNYEGVSSEREMLKDQFEAQYGVDFDISFTEYESMDKGQQTKFDEAYNKFAKSPEVINKDTLLLNLTILITSFSLLISYLILDVITPLKLKNGQTLGKKIFGIAVMRVDGVRLSTLQLLIRTVLGKYTIETMIPALLILMFFFNYMTLFCLIGIIVILILQIVFVATTRLRFAIHDAIAGTVVVDLSSQLIFDTPEELIEYKKRLHAEAVDKSNYK